MSTENTVETVMKIPTSSKRWGTTITLYETQMLTSRIVGYSKLVSLTVPLDGTVKDLIAKCSRVSHLDNEMYILLSEIAKETEALLG